MHPAAEVEVHHRRRRHHHNSNAAETTPEEAQQITEKVAQLEESGEINPYTNKPYSKNYYKILETRMKLPVYERKDEIIEAVRNSKVTIIEGSTGSGKTTQIPRFLLEANIIDPSQKIVCTQPRRVAAINVASRVADEMDIELGAEVGYCVRFDAKETSKTRLTYMTDGLLMREFVIDPNVTKYGIIIIDEAHERTINSDIIIGLLKRLVNKRDDLKVVVMSATLEATKFQRFFDNITDDSEPCVTPHIVVPGRLHKVVKVYTEAAVPNYLNEAVSRTLDIHFNQPEGDILLFLTGEEEIESTCDRLRAEISGQTHSTGMSAYVLPLYASLPPQEQAKVFKPAKYPNTRKIIVSTNIAETSVTIDGVVYVIDPGMVKQNTYNPERRMSSLLVVPISKAAAVQRAGRAGRTRRGICYRLYTQETFEKELQEQTTPEIQRSDLASVLLLMLAAGIFDIMHFPFIDPPEYKLVKSSIEELYFLGAVDIQGNLTEKGRLMSLIPIEPKLAAALISSKDFNCTVEMATIVAMLSEQGQPFMRPVKESAMADAAHRPFKCGFSDHISLLRCFNEFAKDPSKNFCNQHYLNYRMLDRAYKSRQQLLSLLRKNGIEAVSIYDDKECQNPEKQIIHALLMGMFMQTCVYNPPTKQYSFMTGQKEADIHPSSSIRSIPTWLIYTEYVFTNSEFIRGCSEIEDSWIIQSCPEFFDPERYPIGNIKNALRRLIDNENRKKK